MIGVTYIISRILTNPGVLVFLLAKEDGGTRR
jgi:hypothetical protein